MRLTVQHFETVKSHEQYLGAILGLASIYQEGPLEVGSSSTTSSLVDQRAMKTISRNI